VPAENIVLVVRIEVTDASDSLAVKSVVISLLHSLLFLVRSRASLPLETELARHTNSP